MTLGGSSNKGKSGPKWETFIVSRCWLTLHRWAGDEVKLWVMCHLNAGYLSGLLLTALDDFTFW